ncbi:hypothetical protein ACHHYP_20110 [Achlya hypogyna]|uniref:Secreted protein n=1 Tax=Achlya hypogyna TaxID=1202772 RepID=A0A1V9Z638_ACHHY|nr:hypothetical protein ACHHYP_20110 [Achlya hypogyna]
MRGVTPFLAETLLPLLAAPVDARPPPTHCFGPFIVLVRATNGPANAVLITDGRHEIWCFVPPGAVDRMREQYPQIESVHDLRGCALRLHGLAYATPWKRMPLEMQKSPLGPPSPVTKFRVCAVVGDMAIVDTTSVHVPDSTHISIDASIMNIMGNFSMAELEGRLFRGSGGPPHAYQIPHSKLLRASDCIIPKEQLRAMNASVEESIPLRPTESPRPSQQLGDLPLSQPTACASQRTETHFIPVESEDEGGHEGNGSGSSSPTVDDAEGVVAAGAGGPPTTTQSRRVHGAASDAPAGGVGTWLLIDARRINNGHVGKPATGASATARVVPASTNGPA